MKQKVYIFSGVILFLIIGACTGTRSQAPASTLPISSETNTPATSQTLHPQPSLIITPTTIPPTEFPPTLTPMRPLAASERHAQVQELLTDNAGCQLPCWWGIIPGETSWETAHELLSPIADYILQGGSGEKEIEGEMIFTTNYGAYYEIVGGEQYLPSTEFSLRNGIVTWIEVSKDGMSPYYSLSQVFRKYGPPSEVRVRTYPYPIGETGKYLPLFLRLFYPENSFVAMYSDGEAIITNGKIKGCFLEGPRLKIWPASIQRTFKEVLDPQNDGIFGLSLEEATGMSIQSLHESFVNPDIIPCLETPADIWSDPIRQ